MTTHSLAEITTKLQEKLSGQVPFGHTVKFVLGDLGVIFLDGTQTTNTVDNSDREADVTLTMSQDTFSQIQDGTLTGMDAFFQGLLTIEGDQSVAMQLGDILGL
ncbi:MAG: SCP2 sterol-binding domain-containing protein [Pseudomonadota bacterium]|nr:SCP2 sterol-binding domain-containing protein [Pseudomonadota bacterium]